MCDNAMTYNRPDTVYYKLAKKILHAGFKMMSKVRASSGGRGAAAGHHAAAAAAALTPERRLTANAVLRPRPPASRALCSREPQPAALASTPLLQTRPLSATARGHVPSRLGAELQTRGSRWLAACLMGSACVAASRSPAPRLQPRGPPLSREPGCMCHVLGPGPASPASGTRPAPGGLAARPGEAAAAPPLASSVLWPEGEVKPAALCFLVPGAALSSEAQHVVYAGHGFLSAGGSSGQRRHGCRGACPRGRARAHRDGQEVQAAK